MNLQQLPEKVKDRAKEIKDGNPDMDKSTAIAIARDQLNMQDAPTDGPARVSFFVPLGEEPDSETLSRAVDMAADETDTELTADPDGDGALVEVSGESAENMPHPSLDVAESVLQGEHGDGTDGELTAAKSMLMTAGESDLRPQPCFELAEPLPENVVAEAEELIELVAGLEMTGYHNENRLYYDPGKQELHHISLDVTEIVTRRLAAETGIDISNHTIKLLPEAEEQDVELSDATPSTTIRAASVKESLRTLEEDPCEEGYVMVGTKQQNGQTVPNCVPAEDADEANLSAPHILGGSKQLADRIEREQVDENTVRYNGIKALTEGVWTDQESRESIHYMPENLDVELGGDVNVMHDQSDVSESGEIVDYEHGEDARGKDALFVDFELNTDTEAGAYADKALQTALESDGQEGFGGPSVEIPPEGQEIKPDGPRGHPYTAAGKIDGLGLVGQPAAKDTAFSFQTQQRQVALGSGEDALMLQKRRLNMDAEELRETLEGAGIDTSDMEDEDVMDMAESLHDDLMGELDMAEHGDKDEDEEEDDEMSGMEMMEDDAREVMQDMIQEEMDDIWGSLDELKEDMAEIQSQMSEEMSAAREELAAAETVEELQDAKDELDKRLSQIEEQPNNEDRTLAEGDDWDPEYDTSGVSHSPSW